MGLPRFLSLFRNFRSLQASCGTQCRRNVHDERDVIEFLPWNMDILCGFRGFDGKILSQHFCESLTWYLPWKAWVNHSDSLRKNRDGWDKNHGIYPPVISSMVGREMENSELGVVFFFWDRVSPIRANSNGSIYIYIYTWDIYIQYIYMYTCYIHADILIFLESTSPGSPSP
jgi:hypothetical protein